uniref:CSON004359 protein n=1 Tax=Culicoides sonorensis TaxID=179676 RepID=A0A336K7G1_CULSO
MSYPLPCEILSRSNIPVATSDNLSTKQRISFPCSNHMDDVLNIEVDSDNSLLNQTVIETRKSSKTKGQRRRQNMKDKVTEQKASGSFEASESMQVDEEQVLIVNIEHTNGVLSEADVPLIFRFISNERMNAKEANQQITALIRIKKIFYRNDKIVVVCSDCYTKEWVLKRDFAKIKEVSCRAVIYKLERCSIRVLTHPDGYTTEEFRQQLILSNPGLTIKELSLLPSKPFNNTESLINFMIDTDSVGYFKEKNFIISFDCCQTEVRCDSNKGENKPKKIKIDHVK